MRAGARFDFWAGCCRSRNGSNLAKSRRAFRFGAPPLFLFHSVRLPDIASHIHARAPAGLTWLDGSTLTAVVQYVELSIDNVRQPLHDFSKKLLFVRPNTRKEKGLKFKIAVELLFVC